MMARSGSCTSKSTKRVETQSTYETALGAVRRAASANTVDKNAQKQGFTQHKILLTLVAVEVDS